jgi:hypothetical protein
MADEENDGNRPRLTGWMVVIIVLIVAGAAVGVAAVITHGATKPSSSTTPPAPTSATSTTSGAATAAQQVTSCQQLHQMQFASQVTQNPTGQTVPFIANNGNPYQSSTDALYSGLTQQVVLVQNCAWPPPSGADQTGYSQILFSSAPGDTSWPGEMSPYAQADVVDTTCNTIDVTYTGAHTGSSFTDRVTVMPGQLALTEPGGAIGEFPNVPSGRAPTLTDWQQQLGYKLIQGESVILRNDSETVSAATCVG